MSSQEVAADTVDYSEYEFYNIQYSDLYKTKAGPSGYLPQSDKLFNNTSQKQGIISAPLFIAPYTKSETNDDGNISWNVGFSIPKDNDDDDSKKLKQDFGDDIFDNCQEFYQKFGLDIIDHLVDMAVENSTNWFGESLEEEVLRDMITPFIRPETEKNGRTYPPTFSMRFNHRYIKEIKFFDANKKLIEKPEYSEIFGISNLVKIIFTYGNIDIDKGKASFKPHFYPQCIQLLKKGEGKTSNQITSDNFDASQIGFKLPLMEYENGRATKIMYEQSTLNFKFDGMKFLPFTFESQFPGSPKINYQIHGRLPKGSFERTFAETTDSSIISFLTKNSKAIFGKVKKAPIIKRKVSPICKFGKDKEQDPFMRFNVLKNKNDVFNLKLKNSDDDSIITGDDNIIAALTNEEGKLIPNRSYDVQGYCMHMWFKPSDEVSIKFVITEITMHNNVDSSSSTETKNYSFGETETIDNGDDERENEEIPDSDED